MIGMGFISFIILLIIAVVVAAIVHYGAGYYKVGGAGSFLSKVVIAWIGGWLGSPVLGNWWDAIAYHGPVHDLYIIPAILGSLGLVIVTVDVARTFGGEARS